MTAGVWMTLTNPMVDSQVGLAQSQSQFGFAVWCVPKKARNKVVFLGNQCVLCAMLVAKGDCWGVDDLNKSYG